MATWKKVVVSGSTANLANLQVDGLGSGIVTGASGNLTTTAINGSGNIVATVAAGLTHSGSFSGSFEGNGSGLTGITATQLGNSLTDGNGIADFSFDGSGAASIALDLDGSTLAVGASGAKVSDGGVGTTQLAGDAVDGTKIADDAVDSEHIAAGAVDVEHMSANSIDSDQYVDGSIDRVHLSADIIDGTKIADDSVDSEHLAAGGIDTEHIGDNQVTAAKLDHVFSDSAGSFGSTTAVPVITVDAQGRITSASTAAIATSFIVAADTGANDTVAGGQTLTFAGGNGISTVVSDNNIAINGAAGLISASAFTSPSQGTVRATINGANTNVDTGLQTGDSPTFSGLTISNNAVISGDLTVNGTTTTLNTTNTAITDKFILLNSGSANPDQGGIVIDEGSGTGHAFIFDEGDSRFGINQSVSSTAASANSEAYLSLVIDQDNGAHDISDTEYHKRGNIKISSADDIFIYT